MEIKVDGGKQFVLGRREQISLKEFKNCIYYRPTVHSATRVLSPNLLNHKMTKLSQESLNKDQENRK